MLKIKSSTLIEVVVAMTIITMFVALFYGFIEKTGKEINIEQKIMAGMLINSSIGNTMQDSTFCDGQYDFENMVIKKTATLRNGNKIVQLDFTAYTLKNKKILNKSILVKVKL
jgi:hypothetical protein